MWALVSDASLAILVQMPEAHTRVLPPWLDSSRKEGKLPLCTDKALLTASLIARHALSSALWKALWVSREDTKGSRTCPSH